MKEIIKFVIWAIILILLFKVAITMTGALFGSFIGIAVVVLLGFLIIKSAKS